MRLGLCRARTNGRPGNNITDVLRGDRVERLRPGRKSLLGGDEVNYTDLAFAAFTGLWLMPEGYGGGKAEKVRIERDQAPEAMRADIERWIEAFPRAADWVEKMYEDR